MVNFREVYLLGGSFPGGLFPGGFLSGWQISGWFFFFVSLLSGGLIPRPVLVTRVALKIAGNNP